MQTPIHKCMTKATTAEGDQRSYGPNWVTSRRAILRLFDDHLKCGDWTVQYADIDDAVLYSFRSFFLRIPGYILTIKTDARTYHFGLNGWGSFWRGPLPFDAARERGKLSFTWFSILVRLMLFGYLGHVLWQWFTAR